MNVELVASNLVIAAHYFNPSIFSQLWLLRNEIVGGEEEFAAGCLYSDQAVKIETDACSFFVVPPQLQFVPKVPPEHQAELVANKVGAIVRALPHTPFTAVGLNFSWHVQPEDGDVASLTKALFFDPKRRIYQLFDLDDARFGAYFSKDFHDCRLKLDIKPITDKSAEGPKELLLFAFNFHQDIPPEQKQNCTLAAVEKQLKVWDQARAEAFRIIQEVVG